jgi:hypothetical protein
VIVDERGVLYSMRSRFMAGAHMVQASPAIPDENLGLLANGSSGRWDVSIDETISGTQRWFAQIEGPSFWLSFEMASPEIISKAIQLLARPQTKSEENEGKLNLGEAQGTPVALVRDDEYTDRCFLIVGPSDSPTVRLAVAGEDWHSLVQALRQVEQDLLPSPRDPTPDDSSQ